MSTGRERSNENLKKGGRNFRGDERTKALAKHEQRIAEATAEPALAIRRMFFASAEAATKLYNKLNRSGVHDPQLISVSRECRQLADRVLELDLSGEREAEADNILGLMDDKIAEIAERIGSRWVAPLPPARREGES